MLVLLQDVLLVDKKEILVVEKLVVKLDSQKAALLVEKKDVF